MKKILLIGPRIYKHDPAHVGGAIVLFEDLLEQARRRSIPFRVIDTNKKNYTNKLVAYISIVFQIVTIQFTVNHISLHSSKDYIYFAPIVILIGKLFRKSISLRKFGGEAWSTYLSSKGIKKKTLKYIFKNVDFLFLEMKYMVYNFKKINKNTFWFPNVRMRLLSPNLPRSFKKKFVFISHVRREKGIDEILEASLYLDESYTIDIYGEIPDLKYNIDYFKNYNVNYLGPLHPKEVISTLNEYNVLLLPSYKEGYPGIVIEAYSLGIPVIATSLKGLREIVEIKKTGLLIEKKSIIELVEAIQYFNPMNYNNMVDNSYQKFDEFDSGQQTKRFFEILNLKGNIS